MDKSLFRHNINYDLDVGGIFKIRTGGSFTIWPNLDIIQGISIGNKVVVET